MRALSLWQPWASLMALGAKRIETRSWWTRRRGDVVICAAKNWNRTVRDTIASPVFASELRRAGLTEDDLRGVCGHALCVVELRTCARIDNNSVTAPFILINGKDSYEVFQTPHELEFGDYSHGRFAWLTDNLRVLRKPVPIIGKQGLWKLSAAEEKAVREVMP